MAVAASTPSRAAAMVFRPPQELATSKATRAVISRAPASAITTSRTGANTNSSGISRRFKTSVPYNTLTLSACCRFRVKEKAQRDDFSRACLIFPFCPLSYLPPGVRMKDEYSVTKRVQILSDMSSVSSRRDLSSVSNPYLGLSCFFCGDIGLSDRLGMNRSVL